MRTLDDPVGPVPLLPTHQVSDFSRNFRQMQAASKRPYSVLKVIRQLAARPSRLDGFEQECNQELRMLDPAREPNGTLVPLEALGIQKRDLTVGTVPLTVQTTVSEDQPIPFLRVKSVSGRCGCTLFEGLTGGNLSLTRATGSAGAVWSGETGLIPPADQSLDNIVLSPKLIAGATIVSAQLLRQSSPSIEAFVRRDISDAIATLVDQAALFGAGSATVPKGIMSYSVNTPGNFAYGLRAPGVTFAG